MKIREDGIEILLLKYFMSPFPLTRKQRQQRIFFPMAIGGWLILNKFYRLARWY